MRLWLLASSLALPVHLWSDCTAGTYAASYSFCVNITIDHTKVPNTNQTHFPWLFHGTYADLKTAANGGHVQHTANLTLGTRTYAVPTDLIFTDTSSTLLSWEVINYTATTGQINAFVATDLSHTADTVVWLYYGNSGVSTWQGNVNGTWDSNFSGVWHLPDASTVYGYDSTVNGNNVATNVAVTATTGYIAGMGAGSFNGTSAYLNVTDASSLNFTSGTVSALVNLSDVTCDCSIVAKPYTSVNPPYVQYTLKTQSSRAKFFIAAGGSLLQDGGAIALSTGTWYYLTGKFSGANLYLYVNGTPDLTFGSVGTPNNYATDVKLGSYANVNWMKGTGQEFRISKIDRSADWIMTEYNTFQAGFYTFGSENPLAHTIGMSGDATMGIGAQSGSAVGR